MGALFSSEETVITIWRKHEHDIMSVVDSLTETFLSQYCSLNTDDYTPDIQVLVSAFDEYTYQRLPAKQWESYQYNMSPYAKFQQLFKRHPTVTLLTSSRIVVGVKLLKWPRPKL